MVFVKKKLHERLNSDMYAWIKQNVTYNSRYEINNKSETLIDD